jgi:hypothetical protein
MENFPYFSTKKCFSDNFFKIPFGLQVPFFCSQTSLYILKLIVRIKKKSKKIYATLLTTALNHCDIAISVDELGISV